MSSYYWYITLAGKKFRLHAFDQSLHRESVQNKVIREFEILSVDGYDVLEASDALACQSYYQDLSDRIAGSRNAAKLIKEYNALQEAGTVIDEDIRIILNRRDYIIYNCKLCPGQTGLLSKHTKLATPKKLSKITKKENR